MEEKEKDAGSQAEQEMEAAEEALENLEEEVLQDGNESEEETEDIPAEESGDEEEIETEESGSEEPSGEDARSWAEKRAAKKQVKLDKKAEACREQIAQLEDRVKRQLAEFENFRTRTEKEKAAMFETGARSVIEKILPVVDNFERGLATVPEDKKDDPFVDGMNRIYRQLLTELDNIGVKPIEAVGQEFDPKLHNAVMQTASEEYESGVVVQELQKGYTYRNSVVRHSMVAVAE